MAVSASLTEGTADAGLTMDGSEFRAPHCDDPNFDEGESTDLATFDVQVASGWQGTAKIYTSNSVFHFNGEDFTFHSTDVERSRTPKLTAG